MILNYTTLEYTIPNIHKYFQKAQFLINNNFVKSQFFFILSIIANNKNYNLNL